jgi:hypothetical protein
MADVFISYKREDRRVAERLSIALEQLGFEVWWDFELLCGDRYMRVIRRVIDECKAAIVVWSNLSVESDFVMDEALHAKEMGKLFPVRLDDVRLPLGFGSLHTEDFSQWNGEPAHPAFQSLVRALEIAVGRPAQLGSAARTPESEAATAELEAFKTAQIAENATAFRKYLREYPNGKFAEFVRGQIAEIEAKQGERVTAGGAGAGPGFAGGGATPGGGPGAASVVETARRGRGASLALIAIVAVAAMGAGAYGYWQYREQQQLERLAELDRIASPLVGRWAPSDPSFDYCTTPASVIDIAVRRGVLSLSSGERQTIVSEATSASAGSTTAVLTRSANGEYVYELNGETLIMRSAEAEGVLHRCAG